LSGFILAYTYADRVNSARGLRTFAVARLARIYPVYVLALLLMLPLVPDGLEFAPALKTLLLVQAWGTPSSSLGNYWLFTAWSLSIEAAFYLMFPVLMRALAGLGRRQVEVSLVIMAVVMVGLAAPQHRPGVAPLEPYAWLEYLPLPLFRIPEFIFGILLCKLFLLSTTARFSSVIWPIGITVGIGTLLSLVSSPVLLSLGTVAIGILIFLLASRDNAFTRALSSRALVTLGGASYAIYILNAPIRAWIGIAIPAHALAGAISIVTTIAVSVLVFYYYEQPLRMLIRGKRSKPFTANA
jgi:peptidoglycan/LPS O-acetylase OafA/YrhL